MYLNFFFFESNAFKICSHDSIKILGSKCYGQSKQSHLQLTWMSVAYWRQNLLEPIKLDRQGVVCCGEGNPSLQKKFCRHGRSTSYCKVYAPLHIHILGHWQIWRQVRDAHFFSCSIDQRNLSKPTHQYLREAGYTLLTMEEDRFSIPKKSMINLPSEKRPVGRWKKVSPYGGFPTWLSPLE